MKKSLLTVPALAAVTILSVVACAPPPSDTAASGSSTTNASGAAFKACMISDTGGFEDKSFNQTSYKGLQDAVAKLGITSNKVESKAASDYTHNIQAMIDDGCKMIITVGFTLGDATKAAAQAHPDIDFAIVDNNPGGNLKNLKPLEFNTAQSSFEAGYLAAAMTKTGKVGTFGGGKIPTVTIYMDGFTQGVAYYNQAKHDNVAVVGWDAAKQDGLFVPGDNGFGDIAGGKQVATTLTSQGADVLFPVAGAAGEGALQVAKSSSGKVNAIWVDTDGCVSAATYCSSIISSVNKGMDVAVEGAIEDAYNHKFDATPYVGTLANGGTGLAPFHEFDSKVPADVKSELNTIKADIVSGKIKITSKVQSF